MNQNNFKKIWEALYVLVTCFRTDFDPESTNALIYFFNSLKFILPEPNMKHFFIKYMNENPIEENICSCKKQIKWIVGLNNFICSKYDITGDDFDDVCMRYDPKKINKTFWGRRVWYFIHYTALYQPNNLTYDIAFWYKKMITSLSYLLPCAICRNHLKQHLVEFPIDSYLYSNISLFEWTVYLHNKVNLSLGKEILSVEDALSLYM